MSEGAVGGEGAQGSGDPGSAGAVLGGGEGIQSGAEGGGGEGNPAASGEAAHPEWANGFEPEARAYIGNKGWQSVDSLLESYKGLETKLGVPDDRLLKMDSIENREAWHGKDGIFQRLGRPESEAGYEFPTVEIGEGDSRVDLTPAFRKHAFEQGLTKAQAEASVEWFNETIGAAENGISLAQSARQEKELNQIKLEWGANWDGNVNIAQQGMAALGFDQTTIAAMESAIGTKATMDKMLAVGKLLGGSQGGQHGAEHSTGLTSPAQAQSQYETLRADTGFMETWNNPEAPGHPDARAKMRALMDIIAQAPPEE